MATLDNGNPLFGNFQQFRTRFEPADGILWVAMQGRPVPCFSPALLAEARLIGQRIERSGGVVDGPGGRHPLNYVVLASGVPGVFNLGGDIALFRQLIDARDRDGLRRYARLCIDVCHHNIVRYNIPCLTISLVAGSALGGGMESALSSQVVIAERSAELGLPEVLFNLFPGMGAYPLIARRAGAKVAEELITSGRTYTGEELHRLGLVDVLADDGQGERALREFVRTANRKLKTLQAVAKVRDTLHPISHEDLLKVVDIWVDAALALDARDLKTMERLVKAQVRAFAPAPVLRPLPGAAAALAEVALA